MTMIGVYADWDGLPQPRRLGILNSRRTRAQETFEFQYDPVALTDPIIGQRVLDPKIVLFEGPQYPTAPQDRFGMFADSSPDRWGEASSASGERWPEGWDYHRVNKTGWQGRSGWQMTKASPPSFVSFDTEP